MSRRPKRASWSVIAVALSVLMVVPTGVADPFVETCDRGTGFATEEGTYACLEYSFEFPDELLDPPIPEAPTNVSTEDCPEDSNGTIVHAGQFGAGDCVKIFYRIPDRPASTDTVIDLGPECEIGSRPGEDPRVTFWGGGVGLCHRPFLQIGNQTFPMLPGYSLEPCSRNPDESVDPEVTWMGGAFYFCIRYGI